MLVFGFGMGMQFVSLTLMAVSGVAPREAGAASGVLNATQQVGGSLGLSILVTVFGTASRNEATDQIPRFLAEATPAQQLQFRRTGELPAPWGDQVLASGVSSAFIVAAIVSCIAALIALVVIQVRASDLERLRGGVPMAPPVTDEDTSDDGGSGAERGRADETHDSGAPTRRRGGGEGSPPLG